MLNFDHFGGRSECVELGHKHSLGAFGIFSDSPVTRTVQMRAQGHKMVFTLRGFYTYDPLSRCETVTLESTLNVHVGPIYFGFGRSEAVVPPSTARWTIYCLIRSRPTIGS